MNHWQGGHRTLSKHFTFFTLTKLVGEGCCKQHFDATATAVTKKGSSNPSPGTPRGEGNGGTGSNHQETNDEDEEQEHACMRMLDFHFKQVRFVGNISTV
jgi:hypothetical protein